MFVRHEEWLREPAVDDSKKSKWNSGGLLESLYDRLLFSAASAPPRDQALYLVSCSVPHPLI